MRNRETPLANSRSSPETQENPITPDASSEILSSSNTSIKPNNPPDEIVTPNKSPENSYQNRPRRTIIRPSYLKECVMYREECCDLFLFKS
ncbi:hypothetical protein AVEN_186926-1 [Araneus ventricosus]|uniref:Uncharacterized protein n=1 Tax=Araneus ventricosus TaxID=182803 RepID=A0A4Y2L3N7_ARAVE|nr:hypothetical protein AVEN_186926-1 [Araneus ventricosus]